MTTKKPTIGIPVGSTGETTFGSTKTYLEFISKFGNPRLIMPWEELVELDLLVLPGGMDMNPTSYGGAPSIYAGHVDVFKNFFFEERLAGYINNRTPIFGICLGLQELAVYFGSKLTQNFIFHEQSSERWKTAHGLKMYKANGEHKTIKAQVNSHHHQGVTLEDLSKELEPLFLADNNDEIFTGHKYIVEAFRHKTLKIAAVQFHPEELYDNISMFMMKTLLQKDEKVEKQEEETAIV